MNIIKLKNLKSPYVLILIGPPLSGKTTFYNKYIDEIDNNVTLISRDQVVLDVHGSDNYDDAFSSVDQKLVNKNLYSALESAANNHENVILDMTHMTSKRRKHHLTYFDDSYTKVAVIFPILSMDEYSIRNKSRSQEISKTIPTHVIKSMISSYNPISDSEGFDKIVSM